MQIELGALAPKLVEQLAGHVSGFDLAILDEDADAITRLYVRGYLASSVVDRARKVTRRTWGPNDHMDENAATR